MKYFDIGGEERPVHFGIVELAEWETSIDKSIGEYGAEVLQGRGRYLDGIMLAYHGLKGGAEAEGKPFRTTWQEVARWFEKDETALFELNGMIMEMMPFRQRGSKGNPESPEEKKTSGE